MTIKPKTKNAPKKTVEKKPVRKKPVVTERGEKSNPAEEKDALTKARITREGMFPIVGIGASAGGLEAFEQFFPGIPLNIGMAFILVPHLDPSHASMMTELLRRVTRLDVREAADGLEVLPNHIYVIPPNKEMTIENGTLKLAPLVKVHGLRLPIDSFFRSLAEDRGEMSIGIILSGTGTDGTLGLRAIHGQGGMTMAQSPSTAKYAGMPSSAVQTGLVDYILPPDKMPGQLVNYSTQLGKKPKVPAAREERLRKILSLIRHHTGADFSLYKKTTLTRRIEKRMNLHSLGNHASYTVYLQEHPEELTVLFKDLLIGVTQFFRDPEGFEALKAAMLSYLANQPENATFRVWIPACGTGEEAYSIAMIVTECLEKLKRDMKVQIFATDIDSEAINIARNGVYSDNIAADVNPTRLRRYFTKEENALRVKKDIRQLIVFAVQNLIKDPPFTKLDVLSCRNLLIYLEVDLQSRLLPLFHVSLRPGGILFLGTSESIGKYADLFEVAEKKWKIFTTKRMASVAPEEGWGGLPWVHIQNLTGLPGPEPQKPREIDITATAQKLLLETFAPPSLIVNDKGEILYIHGQTGKYLEPAPGRPSWNVFEMAREGIRFELRSGIHYAITRLKERRYQKLRVKTNHDYQTLELTVKPFAPTKETRGLAMVSFEDIGSREKRKPEPKGPKSKREQDERLLETERELAYTRESLQATVEELQASNEELKSTNEEMQSTNEELQSTNEELETSREELQSMNEELTTVNSELQAKIDQLSQAENDMKVLLDNTRVGIVFLDNQLRIKKYTAEATRIMNLIPTDIGRPLHDIRSSFEHESLEEEVRNVLDTLQQSQREMLTKQGECYLTRIFPYRSAENMIDGAILTFTNITDMKQARDYAKSIVETVREPLLVLDEELRILSANRSFYEMFQVSREETENHEIFELGSGQWNIPELRKLLLTILPQDGRLDDYLVERDFPRIGRKRISLNARQVVREKGVGKPMILLAMEDATAAGAARPCGKSDEPEK